MKDTIYGSTLIIDGNKSKTCYFFRNSDFFRRQNIDAVILGECSTCNSQISFKLCLNPYSKNYEKLKEDDFIIPFDKAIIDPIELEKNGLAYIPDDTCERKLSKTQKLVQMYNPILQHLQEKYNTGYLVHADFKAPEITVVA